MKYLSTFVFLGIFSTSFSQLPFVNENKLWSDVKYNSTYGYPFKSKFVKFSGDTVLLETEYTKVFKSEDAEMRRWELVGYIRETDTGTVYLWEKWAAKEELLYDFGIEEGDTILSYEGYLFVADSIRSIPFGIYQEPRNHYYISIGSSWLCDIWIEGIGSSMGVLINLESAMMVGAYRELLCFTEDDSVKFVNEKYNTCFYNTVAIEEHPSSSTIVKYHSGKLEISFPSSNFIEYQLRIFDLCGRQVFVDILNSDESISLDVSDLATGVYIYQICNSDFIQADKILIE